MGEPHRRGTPALNVCCLAACAAPDTLFVAQATGRTFYIDHNTRSTTWVRPPLAMSSQPDAAAATPPPQGRQSETATAARGDETSSEPAAAAQTPPEDTQTGVPTFESFSRTVEDVRCSLLPCVTHALSELFALSGDLHAALYTGSRALNSGMTALLDPPGASRPGVRLGAASSIGISVQRRFVNLTLDSSRQLALEAFLGVHAAAAQGDAALANGGLPNGADGADGAMPQPADGSVLSALAASTAPPRSERLFAHR